MSEEILWIWMSLLGKPINDITEKIIKCCGSLENAWNIVDSNQLSDEIVKNTILIEKIFDINIKLRAKEIYNLTKKHGVAITHLGKADYPQNLLNIHNKPVVLYYYGQLPQNKPLLAVVGSRQCTAYGRSMAYKLCNELSLNGIGIVSGMARGIDTKAHEGALNSNGYTIAILGGGVDNIYPPENEKLYNQIREDGCIISEFAPETPPLRNNFPARNRIISGIATGTLVIEAAKSSGAMITVDRSIEQGRDVFAMPGNINSFASEGTNELIKSGAICITNYMDVLIGMGYQSCKTYDPGSPGWLTGLTGLEAIVANIICNGVSDLEIIAKESESDIGKLQAALTMLEIKGIISKSIHGTFSLSKRSL